MASSKARSRNRPASGNGGRPAARTAVKQPGVKQPGVKQPAAKQPPRPAASGRAAGPVAAAEPPVTPRYGPPLWLQVTSLVLAVLGLAVSAYETYAHYNHVNLAGCPTGGHATFNCTAVITSAQSMVFGVIPVALLGLLFYVFAVVIMTPWAWRAKRREIHLVRLGSLVVGMGFVLYLIYAELYQIGDVCEYCSGVHIITFLLFCVTVVSAALWGLGAREDTAARS